LEILREPQSWGKLWLCAKQVQATAVRHSGVVLTQRANLLVAVDTDLIDQGTITQRLFWQ
jgi:hypothetical protein